MGSEKEKVESDLIGEASVANFIRLIRMRRIPYVYRATLATQTEDEIFKNDVWIHLDKNAPKPLGLEVRLLETQIKSSDERVDDFKNHKNYLLQNELKIVLNCNPERANADAIIIYNFLSEYNRVIDRLAVLRHKK